MGTRRPRICPRHGLPPPDSDVPDDGFRLPEPIYSPVYEDWMHINLRNAAAPPRSLSEPSTVTTDDIGEELVRSSQPRTPGMLSPAQQTEQAEQSSGDELQRQSALRRRLSLQQTMARAVLREEQRVREERHLGDRPVTPPPPVSADLSPPPFESVPAQTRSSSPPTAQHPPSWSEVEAQVIVNMMLRPETTPDPEAHTRWLANRRDDGPIMMQMWEDRVAVRREADRARELRASRAGCWPRVDWKRALWYITMGVILAFVLAMLCWMCWEGIREAIKAEGRMDGGQ